MFPKFLHEKSAYRKNKIYHDVADGKCHAMDTKNVFLDPSYGVKFLVQNQGFFNFLNFFEKGKNGDFVWGITPPRIGPGVFSWCLLHSIFCWLRRGILCFFCRCCFHGEIWETISPVFRIFQRKFKMVPKVGHFLAFLGYSLWPNDIVMAVDGQDERNGTTFAS